MKKKLIAAVIAIIIILFIIIGRNLLKDFIKDLTSNIEKPIIYLYPQETTEVTVSLNYQGELVCTYPEYRENWHVIAEPDGSLTDVATRLEYYALFWEGKGAPEYDMTKGYVIPGKETAEFLRKTLSEMGLTQREYNEFIMYWLPRMQDNPYNLITFQKEAYTEYSELNVTPKPDSMLRVFMVFKALEKPMEIEAPELEPFSREGFCVVEWGGQEIY